MLLGGLVFVAGQFAYFAKMNSAQANVGFTKDAHWGSCCFHRHWAFEERGRSVLNFHPTDGTPDWVALLRRLCANLPSACLLPRNWPAEGLLPAEDMAADEGLVFTGPQQIVRRPHGWKHWKK